MLDELWNDDYLWNQANIEYRPVNEYQGVFLDGCLLSTLEEEGYDV